MRIFTCKHQLEDMMTCIYDAWVYALRVGHDKVQLRTEPIVQATLFDEYVHVDADAEKTEKVLRSVRNKIGMQAYIDVYYACLMEDDVLDDIYRFLRIGFQALTKGDRDACRASGQPDAGDSAGSWK